MRSKLLSGTVDAWLHNDVPEHNPSLSMSTVAYAHVQSLYLLSVVTGNITTEEQSLVSFAHACKATWNIEFIMHFASKTDVQ